MLVLKIKLVKAQIVCQTYDLKIIKTLKYLDLTVPLCAIFNQNEIKNLPTNVVGGISSSLANTQMDPQTVKNKMIKNIFILK